MLRSMFIGAGLLLAGLAACSTARAANLDVDCIMFEDDSFACGHVMADDSGWHIDTSHRYITGCVPEGDCDTYIDDCTPGPEDVACYDNAVRRGVVHPK